MLLYGVESRQKIECMHMGRVVTQAKEGQHLQMSRSLSINLQNRQSTREGKVQE